MNIFRSFLFYLILLHRIKITKSFKMENANRCRPSIPLEATRWETGSGDPESKFCETFGFALFRQGSVLFARFCLFLPIFCLKMGKKWAKTGKFGSFVRSFVRFARICSFSFVVCMRRLLLPGGKHN